MVLNFEFHSQSPNGDGSSLIEYNVFMHFSNELQIILS